ncbi:MAG: CHAT domain-containing tetratricopeptide repeat protein [Gammaproteobacteria bacterium]
MSLGRPSRVSKWIALAVLFAGVLLAAYPRTTVAQGPARRLTEADLARVNELFAIERATDARDRLPEQEAALRELATIAREGFGERNDQTAGIYYRLGHNLEAQDRYAEARKFYERALDIQRVVVGEWHLDTAATYNNLASVLMRQGLYEDAQPFAEKALARFRRLAAKDDSRTAAALNSVAVCLKSRGLYREAQPLYEEALEITRRSEGERHAWTALAYSNLAVNLQMQGLYSRAQGPHEKALALARELFGDNDPRTADYYETLGGNLGAQGNYRDAQSLLEKAVSIHRMSSRVPDRATADAITALAVNADSQGRYAEAQPLYQEALSIYRGVLGEYHRDTANSYQNLAVCLYERELYSAATPLFEKAIAIEAVLAERGGTDPRLADMHANLGRNLFAQRLVDQAREHIGKGLEMRRALLGERHPDTALSYNDLASVMAAAGQYADAQPLFENALKIEIAAVGDHHPTLAVTLNNVALNLANLGRYRSAVPVYEQALAVGRASFGELHPDVANGYANLADAQRQMGDNTAALTNLRTSIRIWRELRNAAVERRSSETQLMAVAQRRRGLYAAFTNLVWQRASAHPRELPGLREESFLSMQDSMASSTAVALAQMGARFGTADAGLQDLVRKRQDLATHVDENDRELLRVQGASTPEPLARVPVILADTQRAFAQIGSLDSELRNRYPTYFALVRPEALSLQATQALLDGNEALLFVVPDSQGTTIMGVSRSAVLWQHIAITESQIRQAVRQLRCGLDALGCGLNPEGLPDFDYDTAHRLYRELVAPVEPILKGKENVFVVASGSLTSLPFSVLMTEPKSAERGGAPAPDTPWLIRRFALTTLPTVTSLRALRAGTSRPAPAAAYETDFVGYGDPLLASAQSPGARGVPPEAVFRPAIRGRSALADPQALRRAFPMLPGTRIELQALQRAFAPRSEMHVGAEATETAVKRARLAGARIVHFATHGLISGELRENVEPGLILTPPDVPTDTDDGVLTASEAAQLHLNADWVVLSACNTAAADGTPGAEALSGLARGFFYAGARTLLVSHWRVRDDTAMRLTAGAVLRLRETPRLGHAGALRAAILDLMDGESARTDPSLAHPSVWAPFVVVGEGR